MPRAPCRATRRDTCHAGSHAWPCLLMAAAMRCVQWASGQQRAGMARLPFGSQRDGESKPRGHVHATVHCFPFLLVKLPQLGAACRQERAHALLARLRGAILVLVALCFLRQVLGLRADFAATGFAAILRAMDRRLDLLNLHVSHRRVRMAACTKLHTRMAHTHTAHTRARNYACTHTCSGAC